MPSHRSCLPPALFLVALASMAGCSRPGSPGTDANPGLEARVAALRDGWAYVDGGSIDPVWLPDGDRFWFLKQEASGEVLTVVDPNSNTVSEPILLDRLGAALEKLGEAFEVEPLAVAALEPIDASLDTLRIWIEDRAFVVHAPTLAVTRDTAANVSPPVPPVRSGNRMRFAGPPLEPFIRDDNVWLRDVRTDEERPVTTDGTAESRWWVPSAAPGSQISPDGRFGVFLKAVRWPEGRDTVPRVYLNEILQLWKNPGDRAQARDEDLVQWIELLRPTFRPYLIDLERGSVASIPVPDPQRSCADDAGNLHPCDEAYHPIGWLPDASAFLFTQAFRDAHPDHHADLQGHDLRLLALDPRDGSVRVLIEEGEDLHVLTQDAWLGEGFWLLSDDTFLWLSERDGWRHLYRYDLNGTLLNRVSRGSFPVDWVLAVDEERGWVYFTGADDSARVYDRHLYRVRLDGSGFSRLTEAPGTHHPGVHVGYFEEGVGIDLSPSLRFFIDTHSAVDRPPVVELRRTDGTLLRVLDRADISRLQKATGWIPPEEFVVKAADGVTDLHGVLYKPSRFDPARSYPVVEYIHNLPEAILVEHAFNPTGKALSRVFELRGLAEAGFVVVKLDSRGTGERGRAFSDWDVENGTELITADHAGALRQLAEDRPWMDLDRVGIMGASRGSLQTLRAMAQAPEVYRVGVTISTIAGTGYSWDMTPAGVIPMLGNLAGPLLMVQGTEDPGMIDILRLSEEFRRLGTQHRVVLLPGAGHVPQEEDRRFMNATIRDFFRRTLRE